MTQTLTPPPSIAAYETGRVDELLAQTRFLWDTSPDVCSSEREAVVCELLDLDLQLERLKVRAWGTALDHDESAELAACSRQLQRLQRRWPPVP